MPHIVAADVESARKASKRMQAGLLVSGDKVDLVPYLHEHVERYHSWMQVKMRAHVMSHMFPALYHEWDGRHFPRLFRAGDEVHITRFSGASRKANLLQPHVLV
jgi:hypothetical protein